MEPFGGSCASLCSWWKSTLRQPNDRRSRTLHLRVDEPTSFQAFYKTRWLGAVRLGHVVVGSASVAEEIAQEAFLRIHAQWSGVDSPDAFLRTVILNLCRSQLRRGRLERSQRSQYVPGTLSEPELDETWIALGRLPVRQRAVLALRYYADLPESEIAALLGCRLGTVKSARHRGLARLRKELS